MTTYPYSNGSLLDSPQHYMYTPYLGANFVADWFLSRSAFLTQYTCSASLCLLSASAQNTSKSLTTKHVLIQLCLELREDAVSSEYIDYWLPRLLKKFEVSKRLYQSYSSDAPHVKIIDSGFDDLMLYLLLAESLVRAWAIKPMSQYVNGLLKLTDTLLSQAHLLNKEELSYLSWLVLAERIILNKVMKNLAINKSCCCLKLALQYDSLSFLSTTVVHRDKSFLSRQSEHNNDLASINSERETSKKVLLLCGHTSRSVAYIQALSKANIVPDSIIVYGAPKGKASSQRLLKVVSNEELFSPNLDLDLLQSLEKSQWQYTLSQAKELDEPSLLALIEQFSPDLIIYSGYGGQLVPVSLLNNYPVLHIHSGWLPDYRGSTTLYYQIIDENSCAASAILLDEKIDTGDIVVRQRYPIPTPGMDVDYLYDNMIRADLLIKALNQWHDPAQQWQVATQTQDSLPYFIIHPLLKHLALLTVDKEKVNL